MDERYEWTTPSLRDPTPPHRGCTWADQLRGRETEAPGEGVEEEGEEGVEAIEMTGVMVEEGIDMMTEEMTDMEVTGMEVTGMAVTDMVEIAMVVIVTEVTGMEIEEVGIDMVETGMERTDMVEDQEGQGHRALTTGSRDQGGTIGPDPGAMKGQDTEL